MRRINIDLKIRTNGLQTDIRCQTFEKTYGRIRLHFYRMRNHLQDTLVHIQLGMDAQLSLKICNYNETNLTK